MGRDQALEERWVCPLLACKIRRKCFMNTSCDTLNDDFKRFLTYPFSRNLLENRFALRIKYQYNELNRAYRISSREKNAICGVLLPRNGKFWYENWNGHVSNKRKCEVDRPSRPTRVNLGQKQMCCFLSCLWTQVQQVIYNKMLLKPRCTQTIQIRVCEESTNCIFVWVN